METNFYVKSHKFLFSLILLPIACILLLAACKEKNFDVRGTWIIKESHPAPIKMSKNITVNAVIFSGTIKIGEVIAIEKNFFSHFLKAYYYLEKSRIEIFVKRDEYSVIIFTGEFINENKMEGTRDCISNEFGDCSGYWEATRVINEKNNSVPNQ